MRARHVLSAPALALGLLAAACSSPSPAPLGAPTGSPSPGATRGSGSPSVSVSPAATRAAAPLRGTPTATPATAEPDFSGTGCYPDIPTPFAVTVSSDKKSYAKGEAVNLVVEVRSTGASRVEHANAQEFDFALETQGQEVWRWSSVAPLIPPTHYEREYRTGDVRRFTATWDQRYARSGREALPGAYVLHGYFIGEMKTPAPPGRFICFDDDGFRVS